MARQWTAHISGTGERGEVSDPQNRKVGSAVAAGSRLGGCVLELLAAVLLLYFGFSQHSTALVVAGLIVGAVLIVTLAALVWLAVRNARTRR